MVFPFPYPFSSRWLSGRVSLQCRVCCGTAECPLFLRPHRMWRHLPAHVRQRWPHLRQRLRATKSGMLDQGPHPHQAPRALWWVKLKKETGSGSFCVHRSPFLFFYFFFAIPLSFLVSTSRKCDSPPPPSLCSFQAVGMSVLDLKCIWCGSAMRSEWVCAGGRAGGGISKRCGARAFLGKTVPSLLHSFTSRPSPHPSHASSHNETPPSCFIHPLPVFSSPLLFFFCACLSRVLLYSCIKRSCSFLLQCFSQCVCLSLSVWPSSWLQVGKVRPPSGQPHRVDSWWVKFSPLTPRWPVRRGHTLLPLSPCTLCLCVSPCGISLCSSLPSCKWWCVRLERSSYFPVLHVSILV